MSVKQIESIKRGLAILKELNVSSGATLSQLCAATKLPRGTVYRNLLTLEALDYVNKDNATGLYWLTQRVLGLSHGFDLENWSDDVAKPIITRLCDQLDWPIAITTLSGTSAIVRENTDHQSSLVFNYIKGGIAMPLFGSASGWVLFAFCAQNERKAILTAIKRETNRQYLTDLGTEEHIEARAAQVRENGYHLFARPNLRVTTLCVPVLQNNGTVLAALSLRYFSRVLTPDEAVQKFLAPLQRAANEIGAAYHDWLEKSADAAKSAA